MAALVPWAINGKEEGPIATWKVKRVDFPQGFIILRNISNTGKVHRGECRMERFYRGQLPVEYRPVHQATINGVPVYQFGYASFYGAPPDLIEAHQVQQNNSNPPEKLRLKKSWEISGNYLGVCTTRMPRTAEHDAQTLEAIHLIDGDDSTCWSSQPHIRPDAEPVWIRIDLARERKLTQLVLKKRPLSFERSAYEGSCPPWEGAEEIGRAMPARITVRTSRDAFTWHTQFDGRVTQENETVVIPLGGMPCKQIQIIGNNLAACENWCYSFSIGAVELYEEQGGNVALASYGNGITASSTHHLAQNEKESSRWYWPLHFDLGVKWSRIGYHDDMINWHWVEREKGVLALDEEAEKAVNALLDNGVNVVYCLNFGNRLYEGYPERRLPQLPEWYYETPFPPKSEEALQAWDRFVRYSVGLFGSRISYYELWNEWNGDAYWGDIPDVEHYIMLAKRTIPIVRECAPGSRIMLGSFAQFPHGVGPEACREENLGMFYRALEALAPLVDAIGWHPFYQPDPESEKYKSYPKNVREFQTYCRNKGFQGSVYMASEFAVGAMYPPSLPGTPSCWWGDQGRINYSELQKAKLLAQLHVRHTGLGVQSLFCELSNTTYPLDLSLLRKGFDSYPIQALNPQAGYYVTRNLCTALDGLEPAEFCCNMNSAPVEVESCCMGKAGVRCLAIWLTGSVNDDCPGIPLDIFFPFCGKRATACDPMNGEITELHLEKAEEGTWLRDVLARDYPLLVQLEI